MTERGSGLPVAVIAGALFCVVLIYLALQIRAGEDPAIGSAQHGAAAPPQVIVRRIVVRRIVEAGAAPAGEPSGGTATSTSGTTAPAAAPAAAAAPAPVPAPAPVVSRGS